MDYIHKTLGLGFSRTRWAGQVSLPYYLVNEYNFDMVTIGHQECIFLTPKHKLPTLSAIQKHLRQLKDHIHVPVVLELTQISKHRKKSLIKAKIPFVVPDKQLYLPFIGVALSERNTAEKQAFGVEKLMPSAQMLLFAFLLGNNKPLYFTEAAKQFGLTSMSISRAASQLVELGLVVRKSDGVRKFILSDSPPSELFERAKPWCINPVRKEVYINQNDLMPDMFPAGLTALSGVSMLNPPAIPVYGTTLNEKKFASQSTELTDSESTVALQIWRYDPRLISQRNHVDVLSLAMSFDANQDERIEQALETLLSEVF